MTVSFRMPTLLELFNLIANGETATTLIVDKNEAQIGHIGEALLRLAVTLHINPNGSNLNVTGLKYIIGKRFDSITNIDTYLASNINSGNEQGAIDVAWIDTKYSICSSKFGMKSIKSIN